MIALWCRLKREGIGIRQPSLYSHSWSNKVPLYFLLDEQSTERRAMAQSKYLIFLISSPLGPIKSQTICMGRDLNHRLPEVSKVVIVVLFSWFQASGLPCGLQWSRVISCNLQMQIHVQRVRVEADLFNIRIWAVGNSAQPFTCNVFPRMTVKGRGESVAPLGDLRPPPRAVTVKAPLGAECNVKV